MSSGRSTLLYKATFHSGCSDGVCNLDTAAAIEQTFFVDLPTRSVHFANNGFALSTEAVLHELAHVVVLDVYGFKALDKGDILGHGVEYARVYVKLLENFLSPTTASRLEDTLENGSLYFKGLRPERIDEAADGQLFVGDTYDPEGSGLTGSGPSTNVQSLQSRKPNGGSK